MRRLNFVFALLGGLACSGAQPSPPHRPLPAVVVLRIDRVDVLPTHPGTQVRWDGPAPEPDNGAECSLLALGATVVHPVLGEGLSLLCGVSNREPQRERDPADPDLTLRLASASGAAFGSYVEPDALSHAFRYEYVIPVPAVPLEGVLLEVLDADAGQNGEAIGSVRITQSMLAEIWSSPTHTVELHAGAVQRLELVVSPYAPLEVPGAQMPASAKPYDIGGRAIIAGEVVSVRAAGTYTVGSYFDRTIDPSGYPGDAGRSYNFKQPPFNDARHACGIALVGQEGRMHATLVAPEARFVAQYSGRLKVGLNDTDPKNNSGHVTFAASARAPSPAEWLH